MNEYAKIHSRKLNYPVNVTEKTCFECKVTKMCHDFTKCKKDTTGLSSYCKQCSRNRRLEFMKDVKNFLVLKRSDAMKRCNKNKKLSLIYQLMTGSHSIKNKEGCVQCLVLK
ncbi:hypothetical protein OLNG_00150 [Ostreococcus lucimarinus virus OlV5]|uniref:hypothetical protein n=1 Tax=Ostreococcus lucimarinus virus OlV5 TaxID=754064 RepID=UPI0002C1379E|nr:hypothetical protein OLNG_00150 [Ostreococcus lucimarinus virus OlV5]AGH31223.1 hypothetical protein OLNG_00150 [Ostreococcus lucimarinus virus OlV5]